MSIIERAIQAARAKTPVQQPTERQPGRQTEQPRKAKAPLAPVMQKPMHTAPGHTIPIPVLGAGGCLVTEAGDRKVYEQFRRLKRPLLQCAFGPLATAGSQLIMVSSPMQGAGKTFVSINLGYVLALEKDRNVLLIDTDNLNPTLTRQLALTGRPGLYDLIKDPDMAPEQAVCLTDVPGLWVLPAGNTAADSLELLNSDRCREVFRQLLTRDPNGIVILDAPPLLVTNEAPAVATLAGQYLLVIEAGATQRSSITRSLEMLDEKKPTGLVLNKAQGRGELHANYPYPYPAP